MKLAAKCIAAAAWIATAVAASAKAEPASEIVPIQGVVDHYLGQPVTQIFLVNQKIKLLMDTSKVQDVGAVRGVFDASLREGRTITFDMDPDSGSFGSDGLPTYVLRDVIFDGRTVTGDTVTRSTGKPTPPELDVLQGIAFAEGSSPDRALVNLNAALADSSISLTSRTWALRYRGNVDAFKALGFMHPGPQRDALLISGLKDVKAWETLAPEDIKGAYAEAEIMQSLGAYDDALDIYTSIYKRWPHQHFWTLIDEGIVYREMGLPSLALDALGEIAAEGGDTSGMPYHYHRGWTLSELGRYDEAVREFTDGMSAQPDYAWAYAKRGCAFAAMGELPLALSDARRAVASHDDKRSGTIIAPGTTYDQSRLEEIVSTLTAAVRRDPHRKMAGLCSGFWDWGDALRPRSKLLSNG